MRSVILPIKVQRAGVKLTGSKSPSPAHDVWICHVPVTLEVSRNGKDFRTLGFLLDINGRLSEMSQATALLSGRGCPQLITSKEVQDRNGRDFFHKLYVRFEALKDFTFEAPFRFSTHRDPAVSLLTLGAVDLVDHFDLSICAHDESPVGKAIRLDLKAHPRVI